MRTTNLKKIKTVLAEQKGLIQEKYGIKEIGIFGSYVTGKQKKRSDLDILVDFKKTPGLFEFVRLKNHLSDLFGVKVDLVMKTALKPAIGKHILEETVFI
ncbi:MAG: nucleotidyltransferase family protein [bacterium]|nr:nucleotidyltransferase family protein [bacterium]